MSDWPIVALIALILLFIFFDEPTLALLAIIALIIFIIFSSKAVKEDLAREYDEMEKANPKPPTYKNVEEHLDDLNEMLLKGKEAKGTSLERIEKGVAKTGKRAKELLEK